MQEVDYLILGAGLAGLAAADALGDRAIVLERNAEPGGLVHADCFDGYWFDRVLHLLYFADPKTEARIRRLLGWPAVMDSGIGWPCNSSSFGL